MSTEGYFEDPVLAEGMEALKSIPAGEDRRAALAALRKLAVQRHPGLNSRMSGSAEEFFAALDFSEDNSELDELLKLSPAEEDEFKRSIEDFPELP